MMKRYTGLMASVCLLACNGTIYDNPPSPGGDSGVPSQCGPGLQLVCVTDIDNGKVCTCEKGVLDPCKTYPDKWFCKEMPVPPDGSNDWNCTWNEFEYTCKRDDDGKTPDGGSDWVCNPNNEGGWTCKKNTSPGPTGTTEYTCVVDNENKALVCEKNGGGGGGSDWNCVTDSTTGKKVCTKTGGLPDGGSGWKCHKDSGTWTCYGETPTGSPPPGGAGWNCVKMKTEFGKDVYKCEKPGTQDDTPDGGGQWTCTKGGEFNGTTCVEGPPGPPPTKVGQKCAVGDKAWCDEHVYCSWGQVKCDPNTGTWETTTLNGNVVLACTEVNNLRPNTVCACYHGIYNPKCCERPDCVIPPGTNGQVCPVSPRKLCDYCNPFPGSLPCVESGAKCIIVEKTGETFCGRACALNKPCPAGYNCTSIKKGVVTYKQCVPTDKSCYF